MSYERSCRRAAMLLRLDKLIEATDRRGAVFDVEIVCVCSAGSTTLESLSGQQHSPTDRRTRRPRANSAGRGTVGGGSSRSSCPPGLTDCVPAAAAAYNGRRLQMSVDGAASSNQRATQESSIIRARVATLSLRGAAARCMNAVLTITTANTYR